MIYSGILLDNLYYATYDKMFTFKLTLEQRSLLTDFMQHHLNENDISVNITIVKEVEGSYTHIQDISYVNATITYMEPSIPAGEDDYWYLLLSNEPYHLQIRSSGMLIAKLRLQDVDENCKILLTDFTKEQCNQFNVPYIELELN